MELFEDRELSDDHELSNWSSSLSQSATFFLEKKPSIDVRHVDNRFHQISRKKNRKRSEERQLTEIRRSCAGLAFSTCMIYDKN